MGSGSSSQKTPSASSARAHCSAVAASHGGVRSPAMRQPWFASTISSMESPTASRTASTTARSARQSGSWKRSLTARTPASRSATDALRPLGGLHPLAARGVGEQALRAPAEQPPQRLAQQPRRPGPRPPPRRSTGARRGSRPSRTARAPPPCGAGRGRPAAARAARRRGARRRSRSRPCRPRRGR